MTGVRLPLNRETLVSQLGLLPGIYVVVAGSGAYAYIRKSY
jgi:hypothetical protein